MKKLLTLLLAFSLTLAFPASALADSQRGSGVLVRPVGSSLSDLFSQMQNQLAEQTKAINDQMDQITQKQQDSNRASDYVKQAQELKEQAEKDKSGDVKIPDDLKDYMDKNGLKYDHTDGSLDSDQWDAAINSLEDHRDQVGADIQKDMADVQNRMGELNSYTPSVPSSGHGLQAPKEMQSLSSNPSSGMQSLSSNPSSGMQSISSDPSKETQASSSNSSDGMQASSSDESKETDTLSSTTMGQSLFSTSGTGNMKTVPIATSLVIGVVLGMAAMWLIQRDKKRRSGAK